MLRFLVTKDVADEEVVSPTGVGPEANELEEAMLTGR